MCNNPATFSCSSCHCRNLYCSKFCQRADWKLHKLLCSSRPLFETPPTASSRRAIVFLTNGEIAFAWETTETKTSDDDSTIWESPVGIEKYFDGQRPSVQRYYNNVVRKRRLKDSIDLYFNGDFMLDGSEKNLAVCNIVQGMDDGGAVWRAPLVALKQTESWVDNQRSCPNLTPGYGHMDMGDLREVVDYLTRWKLVSGKSGLSNSAAKDVFTAIFFCLCFLHLFYSLATTVRSRDSLPWFSVKALVCSSTQG